MGIISPESNTARRNTDSKEVLFIQTFKAFLFPTSMKENACFFNERISSEYPLTLQRLDARMHQKIVFQEVPKVGHQQMSSCKSQ